jgi:hypothetical protein
MAGENIPERVVRKVFSSSINLVVHLDRGMNHSRTRMVRETMEIRAVVPALHEDFSTEAIFSRDRLGAPLTWTGALPPEGLSRRIEGILPNGPELTSLLRDGVVDW